MIVVKVGGSLFQEPQLGPALRRWLTSLAQPAVLVPGGGAFADVVRELDAIHSMSESDAHWLAIHSLSLSRQFLRTLVGDQFEILDVFEFFQKHDLTPHSWAVTSDSLALAYAQRKQAIKLILLKSVTKPTQLSWDEAAKHGLVDEHFPTLLERQSIDMELINFRDWMKSTA